jgi:hypothetical protein
MRERHGAVALGPGLSRGLSRASFNSAKCGLGAKPPLLAKDGSWAMALKARGWCCYSALGSNNAPLCRWLASSEHAGFCLTMQGAAGHGL